MNKQRFNNLINNYQNISEEDRSGLRELVKLYPYSQILHTLYAKANVDAKTDVASSLVNNAAMYASDRHVLKNIIQPKESDLLKSKSESFTKTISVSKKTSVESVIESTTDNTKINQTSQIKITVDNSKYSGESDQLRDEIWADLKNLKDSKANYLVWLEKSDIDEAEKAAKTLKKPKNDSVTEKKEEARVINPTKKVVSKIKEDVVKPLITKKTTVSTSKKVKKNEPESKKKTVSVKKTSGPKIKVIKPPLKEQIKIIDKFIDKIPSISSRQVLTINENQKDLSVSSTEFGEDLVSENLALILVEQGKTQKAIDIYKKLIWKFPQKKAYFAAQIEALNK